MSLDNPRAHHGHAAEYQQSSIPWHIRYASGANTPVTFPYSTRFVFISATTHDVHVAFASNGIGNNRYFIIPAGTTSGRLEIKCKGLWLTSTGPVTVLAGLTNVIASDFPDITGLPGIGAA